MLREPEKVYGLSFTKEEIDEAKNNNRLLTLDLETSHLCNLSCIYCYASSGKRLENELSIEQLKDVVNQAKDCGVKEITIIGGGEPFLFGYLTELVNHIHQLGIQQTIFTNGTYITKERAKDLLAKKVQLVVKMNSLNNEVQDYLADVKGTGEKIKKTLQLLIDIGYNNGSLLGIESIICRQNYNEMPAMWRWARDRNIIPYFEMITFQGRAKFHDLEVSKEEHKVLFNEFLKIDQENYGFTWNPHSPIAGLSCQRHYYNLVVTSNGFVYPCVGVTTKLGNVKDRKLKDIMHHSPMLKTFRKMDEHIHGKCKGCQFSHECYGCRGMAYNLLGDCYASDPLCWENE